jgi:prepilin-type N-terminal cleavage/methylation domain-containing protein
MTIRSRTAVGSGSRPGFTVVELIIVVVLIGLMAMLAGPRFLEVAQRREAANSRDAFVWYAAQARARAVESGQEVRLVLDPLERKAWLWQGGTPVDSLSFMGGDFGATIESEPDMAEIEVCYTPRGVARLSCGTASTVVLRFTRAGRTSSARVWALGQVERL